MILPPVLFDIQSTTLDSQDKLGGWESGTTPELDGAFTPSLTFDAFRSRFETFRAGQHAPPGGVEFAFMLFMALLKLIYACS